MIAKPAKRSARLRGCRWDTGRTKNGLIECKSAPVVGIDSETVPLSMFAILTRRSLAWTDFEFQEIRLRHESHRAPTWSRTPFTIFRNVTLESRLSGCHVSGVKCRRVRKDFSSLQPVNQTDMQLGQMPRARPTAIIRNRCDKKMVGTDSQGSHSGTRWEVQRLKEEVRHENENPRNHITMNTPIHLELEQEPPPPKSEELVEELRLSERNSWEIYLPVFVLAFSFGIITWISGREVFGAYGGALAVALFLHDIERKRRRKQIEIMVALLSGRNRTAGCE